MLINQAPGKKAQAGDRSDQDIRDLAHAASGLRFERILIKRMDKYSRGRAPGEAARMLREEFRQQGYAAGDLVLIAPVIGVGEVAISDHRSAQPTIEELRRLAADTRLGGVLSGKGGAVFVHVGDGESRLAPLRDALAGSDLPANTFYPTHVNRSHALLREAAEFAQAGAYVDITVSTTPELVAAGDIPALQALHECIAAGAPRDRLTVSSDAGGSLPVYRDGQLVGLTAAMPGALLQLLQQNLREAPGAFADVLAALTCNPARALGLHNKGALKVGGDADLLLLDASSGELIRTMCRGKWLSGDTANPP